ncbi:replicative DNA helicase [Mycoplasma capricolum subsp. capripneumoniae]|nr:replicative DNA helicase [Mycoplasma capricolum subsp. capripneumoniae]
MNDRRRIVYAERFVLSAAMMNETKIDDIISRLKEYHFLLPLHKAIYKATRDLKIREKPTGPIAVINYLYDNKLLTKEIEENDIYTMCAEYFTDENLNTFIDILIQDSNKRRLSEIGKDLIKQCDISNTDIRQILENTQAKLINIEQDSKVYSIKNASEISKHYLNKLMELASSNQNCMGIPSGFNSLDNLTSGWQNSDLIILAARPSMGKTAFALNLALNAAIKEHKVALFSLEMSKEQLIARLLSRISKVDSSAFKNPKIINSDSWDKLLSLSEKLNNIYIDDSALLTTQQIRTRLYKLKKEQNIELCVIDYLQLIKSLEEKDKQNEVSEISRQLKQIARELNIPIICLSQLSRRVETREDKRPILSDLRDSGAIEQDADIVTFLYRKSYYDKKEDSNKNLKIEPTELIIAKHRNGATGTIIFNFEKQYGIFTNPTF